MDELNFTLWKDDSRSTVMSNISNHLFNLFSSDAEVDITIKPHKRAKTQSQRGWFHKLCKIYGDEIGLNQGQVKDIVKAQILGWRHVTIRGVDIVVPDGSSEDLSRMEYSELIETLYRLAAESGVVLPNPDFRRVNYDR
jgi:hypothetical protein